MAPDQQGAEVQWITQARRGDGAAFARLIDRYVDTIQLDVERMIQSSEAVPHVVREVVRRARSELPTYDTTSHFETWLRDLCAVCCEEYLDSTPGSDDQQRIEEATWVRRTLAGDTAAFTLLVERYQRDVYTHAYYRLKHPQDAQEAAQEIFHRAYMRLETFDQSRSLRAWLMTITANYCTDMLRRRLSLKRMVQQVSLDVVDFRVFDADANPEGSALRNEQRDRVRQALQQIPEKYREVLLLFYWNDLSYNEIVEVTGLKESTIKTRLHRARAQLLEVLEQPTV
jgi:RNA polymerase sigma-70 factor (ECF subfamily)